MTLEAVASLADGGAAPEAAAAQPDPAAPAPAPAADPAGTAQPAPLEGGDNPQKPVRPDYLPETLWDADTGFKGDFFEELVASKSAADARAATVPADAEGYQLKLPEGFKVPDGKEMPAGEAGIDEKDPRVAMARDFAVANKLTQGEFEQMLGLGVNADLQERGRINADVAKEREKLGGRASERIGAVTSWLDAKLGAEDAASLHGMMFTAKQIRAFERLMQLNRGDVPGSPGAGGSDGQPAEVSDEDWEKMTPVERINYARERSPAPVKKR